MKNFFFAAVSATSVFMLYDINTQGILKLKRTCTLALKSKSKKEKLFLKQKEGNKFFMKLKNKFKRWK